MSLTNFTSETIRLEPVDGACSNAKESERTSNLHVPGTVPSASQGMQKKKVSSFQITSIRPTSRSSNDGADDSENDTEDTSDILESSKLTVDVEQETPSFSDEFSKSDEIIQVSGPVIPTSSHYGITALVQQSGTGGMMTARLPQGVTVNVTEGGLALAKADGEPEDLDNWQKRFKIVKIDSNKPFKRGRWVCLDFMDSPASETKAEEMANLVVSNIISDSDSNESPDFLQIPLAVSSFIPISSEISHSMTGQPAGGHITIHAPVSHMQGGATYTNIAGQPMQIIIPGSIVSHAAQGMLNLQTSTVHLSQASSISQSAAAGGSNNVHSKSSIQPSGVLSQGTGVVLQPLSQSQQSSVADQSQQTQGTNLTQANSGNGNITHGQQAPGVGLPSQSQTSIQSNNVPLIIQPSQSSHTSVAQPIISSSQTLSQNAGPQISSAISQTLMANNGSMISEPVGSVGTVPSTSIVPPALSQTSASTTSQTAVGQQPSTSESHLLQQPPSVSHPNTLDVVSPQGGENIGGTTTATPPTGAPASEESESFHGLVRALSNVSMGPPRENLLGPKLFGNPACTPPAGTPPLTGAPSTIDVPAAAAASLISASFSASTASTVAIDNKIEQAMDLVKSHLMFAVREEVDVLKEKIVELMDRINHLECENTLLRQYASPEVLQQLQTPAPYQIQQSPHHPSTS